MTLWRYYDIGEGLERPYNEVKFEPSAELLQPFQNTEVLSNNIAQHTAKRSDRQLCNLHFCPEYGCKDNFETELELECHVLSGKHSSVKKISTMDRIKESFSNRMKGTITSTPLQTSSIHFETSRSSKPILQPFNEMGWALPIRKKTRFTDKQKKLLYDIFIQGEESGKKNSPHQAHLQIRKSLTPEEYVTPQQIKSLFSRWSQLKQKGKLMDTHNTEWPGDDPEDDSYLPYQGIQ